MADETPTRTREEELADEFKAGLDPASPAEMAQRLDALTLRVNAIEALLAL